MTASAYVRAASEQGEVDTTQHAGEGDFTGTGTVTCRR